MCRGNWTQIFLPNKGNAEKFRSAHLLGAATPEHFAIEGLRTHPKIMGMKCPSWGSRPPGRWQPRKPKKGQNQHILTYGSQSMKWKVTKSLWTLPLPMVNILKHFLLRKFSDFWVLTTAQSTKVAETHITDWIKRLLRPQFSPDFFQSCVIW